MHLSCAASYSPSPSQDSSPTVSLIAGMVGSLAGQATMLVEQ